MGHSNTVVVVVVVSKVKMKLFGFVLLLAFLVSTFAAPLVRDEVEEHDATTQLDEMMAAMNDNGVKELELEGLETELNEIKEMLADEPEDLVEVHSKIGDWFKKVWAKVKAWFEKAGKDIKVLAALKAFWTKVVAKVEATFDKYKDLIIDALKKDGKVILEEAEKLLTEVVSGVAKFIEDLIKKLIGGTEMLNDDVDFADNGIKEFWEKVKAAVKKYFVSKGEEFKKFPAKYGPTLEKLLTKLEQDAASQAQNMAVDFLGDLIKIIMGMPIPPAMNDEEMELSNVDSKIGDWFKMVWAKVKAWFEKAGKDIKVFFDDLGEKIKETFEQLFPAELRAKVLAALKAFWTKVVAKVEATFDKYKDLIIDALKKDGKVILEEAEKLLTEVVKSAAKFIEDLIKKLIGGQEG